MEAVSFGLFISANQSFEKMLGQFPIVPDQDSQHADDQQELFLMVFNLWREESTRLNRRKICFKQEDKAIEEFIPKDVCSV